jgi:basic amino acid/polyamine antiporter, APA family
VVVVAVLSTINATIFTGGRSGYALGRDFPLLRFLGQWRSQGSTPANALLVQGIIALLLVGAGAAMLQGVKSMVEFTAPVFWTFFLLAGLSLFVLRYRDPDAERPFRVPLYPVTPALFCLACGYMLWSSLAYHREWALVGLGVLALGVPLLVAARRRPVPRGFPVIPIEEA